MSTLLPAWMGTPSSVGAGTCWEACGWGRLWLEEPRGGRGVTVATLPPAISVGDATSPLPSSALEPLSRISYNAVDGPLDRRSFHGVYTVRDGLPL